MAEETTFDDVEEEEDVDNENDAEEDEGEILHTDPGWSDYVLSLLTRKEMSGGNPTVDGLRRLVDLVLEEDVLSTRTQIHQVPTKENGSRATVVVTVTLVNGRCADGAADAYYGNIGAPYKNFPVAIAETRAEGRALKRLLHLRKVVSAEEGCPPGELENFTDETDGKITEHQIVHLELLCRDKTGVDTEKFVKTQHPKATKIGDITYREALEMFQILSAYQSTGTPDELKGFKSNWKANF